MSHHNLKTSMQPCVSQKGFEDKVGSTKMSCGSGAMPPQPFVGNERVVALDILRGPIPCGSFVYILSILTIRSSRCWNPLLFISQLIFSFMLVSRDFQN